MFTTEIKQDARIIYSWIFRAISTCLTLASDSVANSNFVKFAEMILSRLPVCVCARIPPLPSEIPRSDFISPWLTLREQEERRIVNARNDEVDRNSQLLHVSGRDRLPNLPTMSSFRCAFLPFSPFSSSLPFSRLRSPEALGEKNKNIVRDERGSGIRSIQGGSP